LIAEAALCKSLSVLDSCRWWFSVSFDRARHNWRHIYRFVNNFGSHVHRGTHL